MRSPRRLAPSRSPPSRQPQCPPTPARPREHPMPDVPTTERATATLVPAVPEPELPGRIEAFARNLNGTAALATTTARSHFADTPKYGEVPARKGNERRAFGIFVDPVHCKGCSECVEVCAALGHDALIMIEKVAEEASGESTLER